MKSIGFSVCDLRFQIKNMFFKKYTLLVQCVFVVTKRVR